MKFTWLHWLVVGLLAVIVCLLLFWPKPQPSETILKANDSIAKILEANTVLLMTARTLEVQLADVRVKSSSDSARFVREITVKNQQLAKKRVVVQHIIDTIPELKEFVETADAVIQLQRQRIDSLEAEKVFQSGLYSQMIYIKDKQIGNLEIVSTQKDIVIAGQAKQLKKKSPKRLGNILKEVGKDVGFFLIGFGIGKGSG